MEDESSLEWLSRVAWLLEARDDEEEDASNPDDMRDDPPMDSTSAGEVDDARSFCSLGADDAAPCFRARHGHGPCKDSAKACFATGKNLQRKMKHRWAWPSLCALGPLLAPRGFAAKCRHSAIHSTHINASPSCQHPRRGSGGAPRERAGSIFKVR